MKHLIMSESTFADVIDNCGNFIVEGDLDIKEKNLYWDEIFDVLIETTINSRWAKLITTKIFQEVIGELEKVDGINLYIKEKD